MTRPADNLDQYTVIRSDNRDVERTQLNKILQRLRLERSTAGGVIDGGFPGSIYTPGPAVFDAGGPA